MKKNYRGSFLICIALLILFNLAFQLSSFAGEWPCPVCGSTIFGACQYCGYSGGSKLNAEDIFIKNALEKILSKETTDLEKIKIINKFNDSYRTISVFYWLNMVPNRVVSEEVKNVLNNRLSILCKSKNTKFYKTIRAKTENKFEYATSYFEKPDTNSRLITKTRSGSTRILLKLGENETNDFVYVNCFYFLNPIHKGWVKKNGIQEISIKDAINIIIDHFSNNWWVFGHQIKKE